MSFSDEFLWQKFTLLFSWVSNWQYICIGPGYGLLPNRWQAITWTSVDQDHWHTIWVNTLRPRQNDWHFTDNVFRCIFLNKNISILINISLRFVPKGPVNNISALVQIMAWHWPDYNPLSEPMMLSLLTHICVTQPQWIKSSYFCFVIIWGMIVFMDFIIHHIYFCSYTNRNLVDVDKCIYICLCLYHNYA